MKTFSLRKEDCSPTWLHVDASGLSMGRLASRVAILLKGKHKPDYTPNQKCGDYVVVSNVKKLIVTGDKKDQKLYRTYSGYFGGLKEVLYKHKLEKDATFPFKHAVQGMLSACPMRKRLMRRLFIYEGEHQNQAQKPMKVIL